MYVYFMVIDFKNVMKRIYTLPISVLLFLYSSSYLVLKISQMGFLGEFIVFFVKKIINLSFLTLIQLIHLRNFYFLI